MNSFIENLGKYLMHDNERISLQRFYLLIAITALLAASFESLTNQEIGQKILLIAFGAFAIFMTNAFLWLVGLAILEKNSHEITKSENSAEKSRKSKK